MGIVDLVADIFRKNLGQDVVDLLKMYEATYPPDWGLEIVEDGPSLMDFIVVGGDIQVVGFHWNATLDSVIALATQDLLLRLLINSEQSRFITGFGVGPIESLPREALEATVALAAEQSPYIAELTEVLVLNAEDDKLDIRIRGVTPTGDSIGLGLRLGGVTS